jgi:putative RNA 2'-phosphotransferase
MNRLKSVKKLAKFLSYVLGRRPDEFGLVPNAKGYVKIKELLKALNEKKDLENVNLADINEVCTTITLPDIEISGKFIRAKNRTNLPVAIIAKNLPKLLFLYVKKKAYHHISEKGISISTNQVCILFAEKELAIKIGKRSNYDLVFLTIYTDELKKNNIEIMVSGNLFYTTSHIPKTCFSGPLLSKEKKNFKKNRKKRKVEKAGYLLLTQVKDTKDISKKTKKHSELSWKNNKKRIRKQKIWPE